MNLLFLLQVVLLIYQQIYYLTYKHVEPLKKLLSAYLKSIFFFDGVKRCFLLEAIDDISNGISARFFCEFLNAFFVGVSGKVFKGLTYGCFDNITGSEFDEAKDEFSNGVSDRTFDGFTYTSLDLFTGSELDGFSLVLF